MDFNPPSSLPGFLTYPSGRDGFLRTAVNWINGKKADDKLGDLWRVHDNLYDLTDFMKRHPGGSYWLEVTRGTDITEAFEAHHLSDKAAEILPKYFVRNSGLPRNSPYSFNDDGFYRTLKRRVVKELPKIPNHSMKMIHSVLCAFYCAFFILAGYLKSSIFAVITGHFLTLLMNCSHNFFHQRDNWRMYAWDLSCLSSAEFRIAHVLSHHLFPNTIYDFELSLSEPFLNFQAKGKNFLQRFVAPLICCFLYLPFFHKTLLERIVMILLGKQKLRPENLLPVFEFSLLILLSGDVFTGFQLWNIVMVTSSFWVCVVAGIAAHHHPDIFHEGDPPRYGSDWGLCQLDAVRDRLDINSSNFLIAILYGEHYMHHLFPTVDHYRLQYVKDIVAETAKEFGVTEFEDFRNYSQFSLWIGMYKQLNRNTPRILKNE